MYKDHSVAVIVFMEQVQNLPPIILHSKSHPFPRAPCLRKNNYAAKSNIALCYLCEMSECLHEITSRGV